MPRKRMVARLKSITAITDLVGERVDPIGTRQGDPLPRITYQQVSNVPINHVRGTTKEGEARFQVNIMASTYDGARELADLVKGDCDFNTPTGLSGWSDQTNNIWHLTMEIDDPGPPLPGQDSVIHRVIQDYLVAY